MDVNSDSSGYDYSDGPFGALQRGIVRRQKELHDIAEAIARAGKKLTTISNWLKVITITLGAIAAAKGTADTLLGATSVINAVTFTLLGIIISVSAGIEAAFKFEKRGTELIVLASTSQATVRSIDSQWRADIGSVYDADLREAGRKLIALADERLSKVQDDAARLGVNITLQVYTDMGPEYRQMVAA